MSAEIANDPFIPLAFAALATERIAARHRRSRVAFPRSPMVVAQPRWDLQANSRGRFVLGLGTQVKGHNERRFSVPWSAPVPRLREYVESLRAIWRCWEKGEPLAYEGEHYRFTLMTPEFSPPPTGLPPIPVYDRRGRARHAAARRARLRRRAAARLLHAHATSRRSRCRSSRRACAQGGRAARDFEVWGGGFVAPAPTTPRSRRQLECVPLPHRLLRLDAHLPRRARRCTAGTSSAAKLHEMSKRGRWNEMAAARARRGRAHLRRRRPPRRARGAIAERFGGLTDTVTLGVGPGTEPGLLREIVQDVKRIPCAFEGFAGVW